MVEVGGHRGFVDDPDFVFVSAPDVGVVEGPAIEGSSGGKFNAVIIGAGALDDLAESTSDFSEWFGEVFVVGGGPGYGFAIEESMDCDVHAEDGFAPPSAAGEDVESLCLGFDKLLVGMEFGESNGEFGMLIHLALVS